MGITPTMAMMAMAAASAGSTIATAVNKPKAPTLTPPPASDEAGEENAAQKAAERRRRQYANVGRSSTILTGPSGLGELGPAPAASTEPKQLLGLV